MNNFIKIKTKCCKDCEEEERDTLIFLKHLISVVQMENICELTTKRGRLYSTTDIRDIEKSIKLAYGGTGHTVLV